eukprot:CAMPEP_0202443654 /NCGR_PEP_ID=MMETSP1360-20130828/2858_1 /ASSEMBLY_ACC=CAM_ASM_000848 /TAXON_ID=515479 /ORGANISM="Licmophora paradoxa, Strain CCMP2313" /LENGTH=118 /DNA_ID=CAMNT_0049059389 /DNA_START=17 /DNA_END=370 /DNA_ORIENTATION=-
MSNDDNKNNNNNDSTTTTTTTTLSFDTIKNSIDTNTAQKYLDTTLQHLKSGIKSGVHQTNHLLASLQSTTKSIQKPLCQAKQSLQFASDHCQTWYAQRKEHGPFLIAAGAILPGLIGW